MKLYEYVDPDRLKELIDSKLVTARKHPKYPLVILNYSHAAAGEKNWDDTLSKCRGLVYEETTHELYAIPFKKFWNYNDESHPETLYKNLPPGLPTIYEKVDGSLGIGFFYKGNFIIATRGSFESDQAKWAQKWADERIDITSDQIPSAYMHRTTYMFEIVMPSDKKVVDYDFSGLVFLGVVHSRRISPDYGIIEGDYPPSLFHCRWIKDVKVTKEIPYEDLEVLAKKDLKNEEGYVAVWYNRFNTLRVKIKFDTYKRLHRMFFQTSTDVIWELLKTVGIDNYIQEIEDIHLRLWVKSKAIEIALLVGQLRETSKREFRDNITYTNIFEHGSEKERRKAFAFAASKSKNPGLLFLLYDGKLEEYEDSLWKTIKPKNSFYRKEEE